MSFEGYNCIAFGYRSGQNNNVQIVSSVYAYALQNPTTSQIYTISGMKTSFYGLGGDSGGPLVYVNSDGTYTLLGMTSASDSVDQETFCVHIYDIVTGLGVSVVGGNS